MLSQNNHLVLFLLMGGSSQRFSKNDPADSLPKQFRIVSQSQLPLFVHTLTELFKVAYFSNVYLAFDFSYQHHKNFSAGISYFQQKFPEVKLHFCGNGPTRFLSFLSCYHHYRQAQNNELALAIHDANRPNFSEKFINSNRQIIEGWKFPLQKKEAIKTIGYIPVLDSVDSLLISENNQVASYLDRAKIKRVQTPQWFYLPALMALLRDKFDDWQNQFRDDYSDEGSFVSELIQDSPYTLGTFDGDIDNIKITYQGEGLL